jgi:peroxiredoxin
MLRFVAMAGDITIPTTLLPRGTPAPAFSLPDHEGREIALADFRGSIVVLWFTRGLFCPFCRRHMAQLGLAAPEIARRGAQVLQVTWNTPGEARVYFRRSAPTYPYLCDADLRVHNAYGITKVDTPLVTGLRTEARSSAVAVADLIFRGQRPHSPLPVFRRAGTTLMRDAGQAIYVLDRQGVIRDAIGAGAIGPIPSVADLLHRIDAVA